MDGLDLNLKLTLVDTKGMLVGSWLATLTYGILLLQLGLYIRAKAKDPSVRCSVKMGNLRAGGKADINVDQLLLKLAVAIIFLVDTTWTILLLVSTYRQLLTVSPTSLDVYVPLLTFVCMPMIGAASLFGVNLFLVWRYTMLTKKTWIGYGLCSISCATFVCYIYSISLSIKLRNFDLLNLKKFVADFAVADKVSKAGICLEVVMVCTIWILLFIALLGYLRKEMLGARRIVVRLLLITAETGTIASIMCVTQLVYKNPTSSNSIIIAMFTARVYYMGMMFTLNMRGSGGQVMREASSSRPSGYSGDSNSLPLSHIGSSGTGSGQHQKVIHVSRDLATDFETQQQGVFRLQDDKSQAYGYDGVSGMSKVHYSTSHGYSRTGPH
ncbi:hypothetical protein P389DRAFT_208872 [Cystobasidium minutum MCA 4210]|uniref:uncharacterized protein n=1 Tax=Cystobasidium minutum MCA 4210 TaxID=1397322 RepID=UPI0034CF20D4|eukprot:jgi/Rhomi1/208872/estExt_Genemark1.C_2_t20122